MKNGKLSDDQIKIIEEMLERRGGATTRELAAKVSMPEWWNLPAYKKHEAAKAELNQIEIYDPDSAVIELDQAQLTQKGKIKLRALSKKTHDDAVHEHKTKIAQLHRQEEAERSALIDSYEPKIKTYISEKYGEAVYNKDGHLIGFSKITEGKQDDPFKAGLSIFFEEGHLRRQPVHPK